MTIQNSTNPGLAQLGFEQLGPEGQIQWILREETSDELWLITLFPTVSAISETYHTLTMFKNTSKYLHNQLGSIHYISFYFHQNITIMVMVSNTLGLGLGFSLTVLQRRNGPSVKKKKLAI